MSQRQSIELQRPLQVIGVSASQRVLVDVRLQDVVELDYVLHVVLELEPRQVQRLFLALPFLHAIIFVNTVFDVLRNWQGVVVLLCDHSLVERDVINSPDVHNGFLR